MKSPVVAFLLFTSSLGYALDWGINVNEVPLVMLGQTTLYVDSVKAKAWLSQPVFGADFRLEGEGSFSAASTGGAWTAGDITPDLIEASFKGTSVLAGGEAGVVEWNLGRRNVTEMTGGYILGSRWDGAGLSWYSSRAEVHGSLGYSGLLQKKSAKVSGSPADASDLTNSAVKSAPQRIYALAGWTVNELFLRQDFEAELLANVDLRSGDGSVHGVYGTLGLTGPLPLGWRQKVTGTGSLRLSPSTAKGAYMVTGELSATIPFLGSRFVLNGAAAQGFGGSGFQPVSGKGLGEVVSLSTAQGAFVGADFSLKPLPKTTLGVKTAVLFRLTSDLALMDRDSSLISQMQSRSTDAWVGTEAGVYASWTPTSETSFGLNGGVFVPQGGLFVADYLPTYLAVVTATLKL